MVILIFVLPAIVKKKKARDILVKHVNEPIIDIDDASITELMGLINEYQLYVSVDTGPFHLAAAINTPMLAIFPSRKVKPTRWAPWRTPHYIVRESHKCPHFCPHENCPLNVCSDEISVTDMVQKSLQLLNKNGHKRSADQFKHWFEHSTNILVLYDKKNEANAKQYYQRLLSENIKAHFLSINANNIYKEMLANDINIVHNFSKKKKIFISILCRLISLKLFNPPLIINENNVSISDIITFYKTKFESKKLKKAFTNYY